MTPRGRTFLLLLLLVVLGLVLARRWLVHTTSPEALEARLNAVLAPDSSSLYRIRIGATRVGLTGSTLTVLESTIVPDSAELQRRRDAGDPIRSRFDLTVPRIEITGIQRRALVRGDLRFGEVVVRQPRLEYRVDKKVRQAPAGTVELPHEHLNALDGILAIDRLQVHDATAHYSERAPDGARFALLAFDSLDLVASGLASPPARQPGDTLVPIQISARIGERARLVTEMAYHIGGTGFNLDVAGGLARTDARILNNLLADLEGIRISSGVVDTISWEFEVREGLARGRVRALYRDLKIDKLDKVTLDQNLGEAILSFFANNFTLAPQNPREDGDPPEIMPLFRRRAPDEPFFGFLWATLRGGLVKAIGM